MTTSANKKNIVEKFLSIFTEVKPGEGRSALLLFLNIFFIMTAYYIMKPVREALIIEGGGAEVKSYASAAQAILLIFAVQLYGNLVNKYPRRQLINYVNFFFIGCLVLFYVLALAKVSLGVIFFLWIGIFNLMVPAQFWSFANDIYTPESGKRLFVIVAFGASLGAVIGGIVNMQLVSLLGMYQLLLFAGFLLFLALVITNLVDRSAAKDGENKPQVAKEEFDKSGGFKLVFKTKYLLLLALLTLFLNWVNTTGEYILSRTIQSAAISETTTTEFAKKAANYADEKAGAENVSSAQTQEYVNEYKSTYIKEFINNFYAQFFTIVNIVSMLIQLFLVSRFLKYLGVRIAILFLPLIAMGGYFFIAFIPILSIVRLVKTAENATDYSLQNTIRQVLWLPTTKQQKYKAKQAIDTFFQRAGDVLSALVVYLGVEILAFSTKHFALFNLALVIVWFLIAFRIGKMNTQLVNEYQTVSE